MSGVSHGIDRFEVVFDEGSLVADAGLLAAGALMGRLGGRGGGRVGASGRARRGGRGGGGGGAGGGARGRKVATLVAAMAVGGSHIDHLDRLRAGAAGAVLGFAPAAPSTVGTFLRSLTWGHFRRLDKATGEILARAWRAGGGPGEAPVAETTIVASGRGAKRDPRPVVRRSRLTDQTQRELWPHRRHHAHAPPTRPHRRTRTPTPPNKHTAHPTSTPNPHTRTLNPQHPPPQPRRTPQTVDPGSEVARVGGHPPVEVRL